MQYEADRNKDKLGEPSLAEMTEKAIRMLSRNPKGYFLFVEGKKLYFSEHKVLSLEDTLNYPFKVVNCFPTVNLI